MLGDTYLFIDGAYLQGIYRDLFNPVFGSGYLVDYKAVMLTFGARRAYLYDCLDDEQKPGETKADFDARVQKQQDLFDAIDKVEGLHVRYGVLSQGRRRQQKEVDVLLAVDMLTHSFSKNMDSAVLLSGDRDFRPVVESLVRLGTLVQVAYDARTGSRDLARAADYEMEIDITTLCRWTKLDKYEDRDKHFPRAFRYENRSEDPLKGGPGYQTGVIGPHKLHLGVCQLDKVWNASVQINAGDYGMYSFHDRSKLLDYLTKQYGEITL